MGHDRGVSHPKRRPERLAWTFDDNGATNARAADMSFAPRDPVQRHESAALSRKVFATAGIYLLLVATWLLEKRADWAKSRELGASPRRRQPRTGGASRPSELVIDSG